MQDDLPYTLKLIATAHERAALIRETMQRPEVRQRIHEQMLVSNAYYQRLNARDQTTG